MTLPLPVCGCGRTLPRPLKPLWPATVWCVCGAARTFPSPRSEKQLEHLKRVSAGTRFTAKKRREGGIPGVSGAGAVPTPSPTPIVPPNASTQGKRADSTVKDGEVSG